MLRSTINRLDQLEAKLDQEKNARKKAEQELRELQGIVSGAGTRRTEQSHAA